MYIYIYDFVKPAWFLENKSAHHHHHSQTLRH